MDPAESRALCLSVLNRQPAGRLLWYAPARYFEGMAQAAGYRDALDFMIRDLGMVAFENLAAPFQLSEPMVETEQINEGPDTIYVSRSPWGALTERRRQGQIIGHRVNNEAELRTLTEMFRRIELRENPEALDQMVARVANRGTIGIFIPSSSALQRLSQFDLGVMNLWYAMEDYPELVVEAMAVYQDKLQAVYDRLPAFAADYYYQGENTSTTTISPRLYQDYSVGQIRQFTDAVRGTGKPAVVHMCGLLKNLMPLFPATGLHAIDCLSPPPVGDCDLLYAYEVMGPDFFCTGRFGSTLWVGQSRETVLRNLATVIPHALYEEHPFVMIVTTDEAEVTLDQWRFLRDCIAAYQAAPRPARERADPPT